MRMMIAAAAMVAFGAQAGELKMVEDSAIEVASPRTSLGDTWRQLPDEPVSMADVVMLVENEKPMMLRVYVTGCAAYRGSFFNDFGDGTPLTYNGKWDGKSNDPKYSLNVGGTMADNICNQAISNRGNAYPAGSIERKAAGKAAYDWLIAKYDADKPNKKKARIAPK